MDYQNSSRFAALWPQQQTKDGQSIDLTYKVAIVEILTGRGGILPVWNVGKHQSVNVVGVAMAVD